MSVKGIKKKKKANILNHMELVLTGGREGETKIRAKTGGRKMKKAASG